MDCKYAVVPHGEGITVTAPAGKTFRSIALRSGSNNVRVSFTNTPAPDVPGGDGYICGQYVTQIDFPVGAKCINAFNTASSDGYITFVVNEYGTVSEDNE